MTKVKVNFVATNIFNFKEEFFREEVILEVANGAVFDTYLKAETKAFRSYVSGLEAKLFGEEASKSPLMPHVNFDFFVDADTQADVYLS